MKTNPIGTDPNTREEIERQIELFLDDFMNEEYKGIEHIVAREHYGKVFRNLLPGYFEAAASAICGLPNGIGDGDEN